jgi:hypothetical protein
MRQTRVGDKGRFERTARDSEVEIVSFKNCLKNKTSKQKYKILSLTEQKSITLVRDERHA